MKQSFKGAVVCFLVAGIAFAVTPQEQVALLQDCSREITDHTTFLRKEISGLKSSYNQLREKEVSASPVYRVLASEREQIEKLMASGGGSDSLQASLAGVNSQMITVRDSIPASDSLQAIGTLIDTRKAAMDDLAAQVMENSSVCQQAYAENEE